MAKIGPRCGVNSPVFGWKIIVPHHIARQQVGRELDPLELYAERRAQRLDEQGLGESGHALKQHVAVGEQRHEHALDDGILANDSLADFVAEFLGPSGTGDHAERVKKAIMETARYGKCFTEAKGCNMDL